jgi:hypothetical protein
VILRERWHREDSYARHIGHVASATHLLTLAHIQVPCALIKNSKRHSYNVGEGDLALWQGRMADVWKFNHTLVGSTVFLFLLLVT